MSKTCRHWSTWMHRPPHSHSTIQSTFWRPFPGFALGQPPSLRNSSTSPVSLGLPWVLNSCPWKNASKLSFSKAPNCSFHNLMKAITEILPIYFYNAIQQMFILVSCIQPWKSVFLPWVFLRFVEDTCLQIANAYTMTFYKILYFRLSILLLKNKQKREDESLILATSMESNKCVCVEE